MSDQRPPTRHHVLEEATISNMWEIGAIVEFLERKGLCGKQDLYDIITELRKKNPRPKIPETAFPEMAYVGGMTLPNPALTHHDNVGWCLMKKACLEHNLDPELMKRDNVQPDELSEEQWNSMCGC